MKARCARSTLVGIARFGDVDSLGGATIALFDVPTARAMLAKDGFDAIAVGARDGVSESELIDAIDTTLPENGRRTHRRAAGG